MVVYENARRCGLGIVSDLFGCCCAARFGFFERKEFENYIFYCRAGRAFGEKHEALKQISDAKHEIGNHSFNHEPWLHLYSKQELVTRI